MSVAIYSLCSAMPTAGIYCLVTYNAMMFSRYLTALTDSDEDEPGSPAGSHQEGEEEEGGEQPVDGLVVLLESVDALQQGDDGSKKKSFETLLENKVEAR